MAQPNLRIAFIGAGGICRQRHLPGLKAIDGIELVAVCNRTESSGRTVADEWGFADVMTDWRALVARDDIDAVFIGTWPYMHREMSVAALEGDKHVFCQARMCMDWAEAQAMYAAARTHPSQVNMVCPPPTRMPWEPAIGKLIADGQLGQIRHVHLVSFGDGNVDATCVHWREQIEYSGLQVLGVGIFAETLNAWVGDYRTLIATLATPIRQKTGPDGKPYEIRIPQIVTIQGELASGATIDESHSGLALHDQANHVTVFGSEGTLRVEFGGRIQFGRADQALADWQVPEDQARPWQVEADFVSAVRAAQRGEAWSVSPDFAEALRYMRKMQAVHDSAARCAVVDLDADYPLPV